MYVLVSQVVSSHPGAQTHVYPATPSIHEPPFRHGAAIHLSSSDCQNKINTMLRAGMSMFRGGGSDIDKEAMVDEKQIWMQR